MQPDPARSRWQWLAKWLMVLPHHAVLLAFATAGWWSAWSDCCFAGRPIPGPG